MPGPKYTPGQRVVVLATDFPLRYDQGVVLALVSHQLKRELPSLPMADGDDGYDWMHALRGTEWLVVPSWRPDNRDLGNWPFVVVATCSVRPTGPYGVAVYDEGDLDVRSYDSNEERLAALDRIAEFYWRLTG